MAIDLDMSISAYRKIETGETKLTVDRLFEISKILETPIEVFLETAPQKVFNQEIKEQSVGYAENIYQDNAELSKKIMNIYEKKIAELETKLASLKSSKS